MVAGHVPRTGTEVHTKYCWEMLLESDQMIAIMEKFMWQIMTWCGRIVAALMNFRVSEYRITLVFELTAIMPSYSCYTLYRTKSRYVGCLRPAVECGKSCHSLLNIIELGSRVTLLSFTDRTEEKAVKCAFFCYLSLGLSEQGVLIVMVLQAGCRKTGKEERMK